MSIGLVAYDLETTQDIWNWRVFEGQFPIKNITNFQRNSIEFLLLVDRTKQQIEHVYNFKNFFYKAVLCQNIEHPTHQLYISQGAFCPYGHSLAVCEAVRCIIYPDYSIPFQADQAPQPEEEKEEEQMEGLGILKVIDAQELGSIEEGSGSIEEQKKYYLEHFQEFKVKVRALFKNCKDFFLSEKGQRKKWMCPDLLSVRHEKESCPLSHSIAVVYAARATIKNPTNYKVEGCEDESCKRGLHCRLLHQGEPQNPISREESLFNALSNTADGVLRALDL